MSQNAVIVTYYLGRRKRGSSDGFTYEVWVFAEVLPDAPIPAASQRSVDRPVDSAAELGEQLRDAVSEDTADHVERLVWTADDVPEGQLDGFIAGLPERLQALADEPLDVLAGAIGMAAATASLTSQVAGTLLLKPVLEPVGDAVHGFEVAGVVIGLLTGAHALVFTCVQHLVHDMLGDLLSKVVSEAAEALDRQLSESDADPVTTDPWELELPEGLVIVRGQVRREEHDVAQVADAAPVTDPQIGWLVRDQVEDLRRIKDPRDDTRAVSDPSSGLDAT